MNVDDALTHSDYVDPDGGRDATPRTAQAARILAAEVRRLRAGVERVRALHPVVVISERDILRSSPPLVRFADVLAALKGE